MSVTKKQHSKNLDEDKLEFASLLINRERDGKPTPMDIVIDALQIMQFGGITMQDILDWHEATGR